MGQGHFVLWCCMTLSIWSAVLTCIVIHYLCSLGLRIKHNKCVKWFSNSIMGLEITRLLLVCHQFSLTWFLWFHKSNGAETEHRWPESMPHLVSRGQPLFSCVWTQRVLLLTFLFSTPGARYAGKKGAGHARLCHTINMQSIKSQLTISREETKKVTDSTFVTSWVLRLGERDKFAEWRVVTA